MNTKNKTLKISKSECCPECERHRSDKKQLLLALAVNKAIPEWVTEILIKWGNLKDA